MKKLLFSILAFILLFGSGCASLVPNHNNPAPTPQVPTPQVQTPKGETPESVPPQAVTTVKIFLIALEDNGKSGKALGTGDSLVPVLREINTPVTPLRGALEELLALKDRNYGQSGLYNPLCSSDLKVESINVNNGLATIYLTGKMSLGGVMDIPRVEGQLKETALQFSTVKTVIIYLNGVKLEDALSLK